MGVLCWTPLTVREAALDDLADAYLGYAEFHGLRVMPGVTKKFLDQMLQKFPDRRD